MRAWWLAIVCAAACGTAPKPALQGPVKSFDALPRMQPRSVLAYKEGGGVEAYRAHGDEPLLRVKTWPAALGYTLVGQADEMLAAITTPAGVEIYELGAWDRPVLTAQVTHTTKLHDALPMWPYHAADARWRGLALQEDGANTWRLFWSEDGRHWGPLELPGVAAPLTEIRRIGAGGVAVHVDDGWRTFRHGAHGWEAFELPGIGPMARDVVRYDDGRVISVAPPGDGSKPVWFAWQGNSWAPLATVIPGAPEDAVAFRTIIFDRVVAIRPGSGSDAFRDRYFVRTDAGWKRLQDVMPGAPTEIGRCHAFANDRGLLLASSPSPAQPVPQLAAYWLEGDRWKPAGTTIPGLAAGAWDITEDSAHAFALRGDKGGEQQKPFHWRWLVELSGKWQPLQQALGEPRPFEQAVVDAAANAAAVVVEHDAADKAATDQKLFVRSGERFVPLAAELHATWTPAHLEVSGEAETIVRISDVKGALHFLIERDHHWVDLGPELEH